MAALAAPESVAADADPTDEYPNYYEARRAQARSDCDAVVDHLSAFLRNHPSVREKHPDFYIDIEIVMGQCDGSIKIRVVEGESGKIAPLPSHPPMVE